MRCIQHLFYTTISFNLPPFIYRVAEGVVDEGEKSLGAEKLSGEDDAAVDGEKEAAKIEVEEKEPEDKVNNN